MNNYKIYGQQGVNDEVITHYLNVIVKGIKKSNSNCSVERARSYKDINKKDICIFYTFTDAIRILIRKKVKFYIWFQGIYPEERQLYAKGKFDYILCSFLEKIVLKKANKIFVVSEEMIKFYEKKYKIKIKEKSLIIPCYNDSLKKESFYKKNKYEIPTFTYVGSLSKWQCFEKTVLLFKKINTLIPNAKFYVYTKNVDEARNVLNKNGVKNFYVNCVKPEEINEKLSTIKYGFIIRENISINNVATPTKFANYLSAGVIPIISSSIKFYDQIAKNSDYIISEENEEEIIKKVVNFESRKIYNKEVFENYFQIFNKYFNDEKNEEYVSNFLQ